MTDIDFEILNAISKHQNLALDFAFTCDYNLFSSSQAKKIGKAFIDYIKLYKCKPSQKSLLDRHNTDEDFCELINNFYENFENVEYNPDDYKYDVDRLKQRYSQRTLESLRDELNESSTLEDISSITKTIELNISNIKAAHGQKAYDRKPVRNYIDEFRENYIQKTKNPDLGKGILTGYSFFDYLKNGLRPADLIIIAGETGSGKALDVDTDVPTPNGWKKMGDLKVGDFVIGDDGKPSKVIQTSGIMTGRPTYEIEFSDGAKIIADENHEWETSSFKERKEKSSSIKTTKQIYETLRLSNRKDNRLNHSVKYNKPIDLPKRDLDIDPYVLGVSLGNDSWIGSIPLSYLRGSIDQRLALVQGLMDTNGTVSKRKGSCEFKSKNINLVNSMAELLRSLGTSCNVKKSKYNYRISFSSSFPAFKLDSKLKYQNTNLRFNHRFIKNINKINSRPVQCIKVDNDSHMFLCGKEMIPTHNSMFMNNIAVQIWMQGNTLETPPDQFKKGYNVTYFSLEMPYEDCFRRSMARIADVQEYGIRDAKLSRAEAKGLSKACKFMRDYPYEFDIVDVPRGFTVEQMELMFEEIKSEYIPDVIFIDYLGLMEDVTDGEDWLALGKLAGKVHEFSRAHSIPIVTAVQLNRLSPEFKKNEAKAIGLHRIGRSALIATHATAIIQLETRVDEQTHDDFIYHFIKNRHGQSNKSHSISKNFNKCSIIDKPYDIDSAESWTSGEDISEDVSDILGL